MGRIGRRKYEKAASTPRDIMFKEPWERYIQSPTQFGQVIFERTMKEPKPTNNYPKL